MSRLFLLSILLIANAAMAEVGYRIVHPDGTVEFTDQPRKGAEEIELREVPTTVFESVKPAPVATPKEAPEKKKPQH